MRDFNEVRLLGNVANELKHRKTPWNTSEYHCRLAIHNTWKDYKTGQTNKKTDFINIKILPGNSPVSAAILEKIKVGSKLFVSGKIKQRDYDGKNGEKHDNTFIKKMISRIMEGDMPPDINNTFAKEKNN